MKAKYYIPILVALIIAVAYFIYQRSVDVPEVVTVLPRSYPEATDYDLISVSDLKNSGFTSGNINLEGYVVKIDTCAPCPKGVQCGVCAPDSIVISEKNELLDAWDMTDSELIIRVENPRQFELGKRYRVSVEMLDTRIWVGEPINDVKLVGYSPLF